MNTHGINEAAINESAKDVTVRVLLVVRAYALAVVSGRVFRRGVVTAQAASDVQAVARANRSSATVTQARGDVSIVARVLARSSEVAQAIAQITLVRPAVQVFVACYARATSLVVGRVARASQIFSRGTAVAKATASRITAASVSSKAAVQISAISRAALRAPVSLAATADIDANPNTVKRVQFDEYAVDAQTFVVPFEDNVFFVR